MFELHLSCGDTISSKVEPRLGAYRKCIHCDGNRKVVGIQYPPDVEPVPTELDRAVRRAIASGQTSVQVLDAVSRAIFHPQFDADVELVTRPDAIDWGAPVADPDLSDPTDVYVQMYPSGVCLACGAPEGEPHGCTLAERSLAMAEIRAIADMGEQEGN